MFGLRRGRDLRRAAARAAVARADWLAAAEIYAALAAPGVRGLRDRIQLAHCLKEGGEAAAAEAAYRQAAEQAPFDLDAQRQLGLFLRRLGRGAEAVDWLLRANVVDPDDAETRAALADHGLTAGEIDARLPLALLRGPDAPAPAFSWSGWARRWLAWLAGRAEDAGAPGADIEARLARGDAAGALQDVRRALLRAPRSFALHLIHAQVLSALERPKGAAHAALTAWRLRPGCPDAAASLEASGWLRAALDRLASDAWAPATVNLAGRMTPPAELRGRARAIWSILASGPAGAALR